jgi:tetratricopeptide (TPR) repeat protein
MGTLEEKAENFTKAVESYRKAMAEDACIADLASAALALGKLELGLGEHDKADASLRRAVELNSASPRARAEAYVSLAKNAEARGDAETARKYATVVTSLFADEELCAEANKILGEHQEAAK